MRISKKVNNGNTKFPLIISFDHNSILTVSLEIEGNFFGNDKYKMIII
jgi:hypothetical protein